MKRKSIINLGILLFTIGTVLAIRTETRKTSYRVHKKYVELKQKRQDLQQLMVLNHGKEGYNFTSSEQTDTLIAIRANKAQKVVMVQKNLMVTTR